MPKRFFDHLFKGSKERYDGSHRPHPADTPPVTESKTLDGGSSTSVNASRSSFHSLSRSLNVSAQQPATTISEALPPTTPPAQTGSTGHLSTSSTSPSAFPDLHERLWNKAYDELKEEGAEWVEAYERILSHELEGTDSNFPDSNSQKNEIEGRDYAKRRSQMELLIQRGLDKTQGEANVK